MCSISELTRVPRSTHFEGLKIPIKSTDGAHLFVHDDVLDCALSLGEQSSAVVHKDGHPNLGMHDLAVSETLALVALPPQI